MDDETDPADHDVLAEHRRRNELSRGSWEQFASHRQHVTQLLLRVSTGARDRLCVLGAGNSGDIALPDLTQKYAAVDLVDIDERALRIGIERQGMQADPRITPRHVDVTGIARELSRLTPESVVDDALLARLQQAGEVELDGLSAPYDVVASVCLLTQLIDSVVRTLGEPHPRFAEVMLRIRDRHLRLLIELLRPGGTALLITDIVSSDTCPDLPQTPAAALPAKVGQLINQRNFFSGVNPFVLRQFYEQDARVAPLVLNVQLLKPWLWDFGPRVYAVTALSIRRKPSAG